MYWRCTIPAADPHQAVARVFALEHFAGFLGGEP
jgi:hypothetical protein